MNISDLDYELPPERIAQYPPEARDSSRLLLLDRATGALQDHAFREFPEILRGDELIVVNDVRVLPARLFGRRKGTHIQPPGLNNPARQEFLASPIEVLLVKQREDDLWESLVRPGRKIRTGEQLVFGEGELEAIVEGRGEYGLRLLRFRSRGDLDGAIARLGHIPLPPYVKRADEPIDRQRYQTIFAQQGAAVASPTAGLHFTPEIVERVRKRGVQIVEITLEVGLGTFQPVRTQRIEDHKIHSERYEISASAAVAIREAQVERRPILAIGTTVVRALEDAAEKGGRAASLSHSAVITGKAEAEIFLYPGKNFCIVDQLLSNFHLPKSSLLALVCAFAGREHVLEAYRHAVEEKYRFYSYGDCMLIR